MIEGQILLGLTNELKKALEEVGDTHLEFFFANITVISSSTPLALVS